MKRTIKILGCIGLALVAFAIESNASSEIATGAVSLKMTRPFVTAQEIVMATFIISNWLDNAIAFLNM